MNLKRYLNLQHFLHTLPSNHEENRAIGLAHKTDTASQQLMAWEAYHQERSGLAQSAVQFCSYLYGASVGMGMVVLLLGIFTGIGLLHYSGDTPVNVIYFLVIAILLPAVSMLLSLVSMLRVGHTHGLLIHLSPAYWMERIASILPVAQRYREKLPSIDSELSAWLVIKRAQMLGWLFSAGLLLALLGTIATQDIAFAWSTTLEITAEGFHRFLALLAWPWHTFCPAAVPSVALIEQSQYYRLGQSVGSDMAAHAAVLGQWWRFLACATLFYALVMRLGVWLVASWGYRRALHRALLKLEGAQRVLYEMNTPLVTTEAPVSEPRFRQTQQGYSRRCTAGAVSYDIAVGWAMEREEVALLNDALQLRSSLQGVVGGRHTLEEDRSAVQNFSGEILLYVKAWEPPTMELVDMLMMLSERAARIALLPVGMAEDRFQVDEKTWAIWERKLAQLDHPKVWLCHLS